MSKKIQTEKAAAAIGPYSQGICSGNLLFTSGQIPVNPTSGEIPAGIEAQTEQALENLKAIAEEAGTTLVRTVKTTCFLTDMAHFARFNEIYAHYFSERPARSCIAVKALPRDVLVEVEAIIELQ
ncbi:MAG: RidA family protein [Firmicutes bacterium]|jgi:reactive intermediate/imine deaminase|nr:RidA family protein [Bacillota bacterium]